jgi:hypothetical protein
LKGKLGTTVFQMKSENSHTYNCPWDNDPTETTKYNTSYFSVENLYCIF